MNKFCHIVKTSVFALGIAIFGLAPAAQAMSDQRHSNNNRHSYNNHSNRHNVSRHSNRHSYSSYGYSGRFRHGGHHGGHGGDVALGLLTGGLLFYALTANQRSYDYGRTVYVQQQPVYVQPTQQQWTQQQQPAQPQNPDGSCLQVREYQTTITVGSQSVPAYGQSCLQPDGTWKLGPAIPEPGY